MRVGRQPIIYPLACIVSLLFSPGTLSAEPSDPLGNFKPYYASFRSNEVNMRVGPSKDHPITWVYHRKGLPVRVIDTHNEWREVVDPFNDHGWVKKSLLAPRRTVMTHSKTSSLRSNPSITSAVIAEVEPGVVCGLNSCNQHWCKVDAGPYRGWLEKSVLWGVEPTEILE